MVSRQLSCCIRVYRIYCEDILTLSFHEGEKQGPGLGEEFERNKDDIYQGQ